MRTIITAYLSTLLVYLALDFVWLSLAGGPVYKARLGAMLLDKPQIPYALAFYVMFTVAMIAFAVLPALTQNDWGRALWAGALLGFSAYGTYDLTNQSTLVGWSGFVSIVDMAWGTFVVGAASTAGFFITRALTTAG